MKTIAILGASGGLGEVVATAVAARGPVCLGYARHQDKTEKLAERIRAANGDALCVEVDIRNADSVANFLATANRCGEGLGAVISATGPAIPLMPMTTVSDADFDHVYATDVRGAFNVLKHGALALKANGGGSIVMFLTTAVLRTLENDGMSGCPKTAVGAMVKQIAREMGPYNVRCNGIAPAVIDAGVIYAPEFEGNELAQGVIRAMVDNTPLRRMGRPEEVSAVVDFLISPGASYINGQIIGVDGGFSA
jgi:3-oxoacyl-[acyl-carrier protein] reductase